ncbi:hypothetical protein HY450_01815 [Candidatus Pacearchaeota archaeon]|nr:hypothetical protein [Candidatus Pacearchaeota archaeon]
MRDYERLVARTEPTSRVVWGFPILTRNDAEERIINGTRVGTTFTSVPRGLLHAIVQAVTFQGIGSAENRAYLSVRREGRKARADFAVIDYSGVRINGISSSYELTTTLYKQSSR